MSVSGGFSGTDDSQEALSKAAADGALPCTSSSTPGFIGKATNERVGQPESRDAGAPRLSKRASASLFVLKSWKRRIFAVTTALLVVFNFCVGKEIFGMGIIYTSAAVSVGVVAPQASLQVALHVTKRQNGAKASNRVSVSGGFSGTDDSQEALSKAAADGAFGRWSGRINAGGRPEHGV